MAKIHVYSTKVCPFCIQAKRLLESLSLPFEETLLDDKPDLRMKLSQENNGWRTVPMIFIGEEFIGGFQDLAELHQQGQLIPKAES